MKRGSVIVTLGACVPNLMLQSFLYLFLEHVWLRLLNLIFDKVPVRPFRSVDLGVLGQLHIFQICPAVRQIDFEEVILII